VEEALKIQEGNLVAALAFNASDKTVAEITNKILALLNASEAKQ